MLLVLWHFKGFLKQRQKTRENSDRAALDINKLEEKAWDELDLTVNISGHGHKP